LVTKQNPASAAAIGSIIVGGILLLLVFPLMFLVAVWIKCDSSGPVLERKDQIGPDGRRVSLFKFRTTRHGDPVGFARKHRTRAGEFLHYTHLEYLPNLLNLAHGDIGLAELCRHHLLSR
jgi:lipopolysaccharide/colanic/teichoic acid biosynthesis glycosyltransferase